MKWYKSPFPALNVHWRDEPVATDMIYSDTPAIDSGTAIAQVFVGTESLITDVYAIKTVCQYPRGSDPDIWCTNQASQWPCSGWNQQTS